MKNRYPTEFETIEEAKLVRERRLATVKVGSALRYRPVIVKAPSEKFMVVEIGWAIQNNKTIF